VLRFGFRLGLRTGLKTVLGDGYINKLQLSYSSTCCDIHRSPIHFLPLGVIVSVDLQ